MYRIFHFVLRVFWCCGFALFLTGAEAQSLGRQSFREICLTIDTSQFCLSRDTLIGPEGTRLRFAYVDEQSVCEFRLWPHRAAQIEDLRLHRSADFRVIDAPAWIDDSYFRLKIQFEHLTRSRLLSLVFDVVLANREEPLAMELKLFPTTITTLGILIANNELFVGEERAFRLECNKPENIKFEERWTTGENINYRFSLRDGVLRLHVLPNRLGLQHMRIPVQTHKPRWSPERRLVYELPPLELEFVVKPSKLRFLEIHRREIIYEEATRRQGVEVEMDYQSEIALHKTYRVENQEEPGGALIAEIFTRSVLGNGRVLCWFRPYDFHRRTNGYLYIKDGDKAINITNVDIVPEPKIQSISLLRGEGAWTSNTNVFPGERLEIRLEGEGLSLADIRFDGLDNVRLDTSSRSDRELFFTARVPLDARKRKIEVYNGLQPTGHSLNLREYERSRPLDFVRLTFQDKTYALDAVDRLLIADGAIPDIILSFDHDKIDQNERLFGKQYLNIEIRITASNNTLVDTRTVRNIVICPSIDSPRYGFYNLNDCQQEDIRINSYLRRKTFDLEDWSTIEITVEGDQQRYGQARQSKRVEIVLRRLVSFDIDVSFPAGLLIKRLGEPGFGNLGGISMAMMGQFSFYHPEKIARFRPYKFGVGFLALNAFNFSAANINRDLGAVALASFFPIQSSVRNRLSFPLYVGGGYFLSQSKWFLLIGPGIRVSF
jgi:hypothetical protein